MGFNKKILSVAIHSTVGLLQHLLLVYFYFCVLPIGLSTRSFYAYFGYSRRDDSGVVYVMLLMLMVLNVVTPIIACIYQRYGSEWIHKAQAEIERVTSRISDRLSDAGRKLSQQMRV